MLGEKKRKRSGPYRLTLSNKAVRVRQLSDWFPLQIDPIQKKIKYPYIQFQK